MTRPSRAFNRWQVGYTLIELTLAIILIATLAGIVLHDKIEDDLDRKAVLQGQSLATVQAAFNAAVSSYYDLFLAMPTATSSVVITIGAGPTTVTIADGSHPTIANLVDLGNLPAGFSATAPMGGTYQMALWKTPTGCVTPNCNIEGLVWVDSPIRTGAGVDGPRVGLIVSTVGADGAASTLEAPGVLAGYNGQWSAPNPVTPAAAGIVAARAGYMSAAWAPYFRIDGTRWMTGDGNFGGHSLVNAKQVETRVKALGESCTDVAADATKSGPTVVLGGMAAGTMNSHASLMVCSDGVWVATGAAANPGDACAPDGAIATAISNGEQLVCKKGVYIKVAKVVAKTVEVSRVLVGDGTVVPKPVIGAECDLGGAPDYSFDMNQTAGDLTSVNPQLRQSVSAIDIGASWQVKLVLMDDAMNETSGNVYGPLRAIMHRECRY